jgi:hypothetical protein
MGKCEEGSEVESSELRVQSLGSKLKRLESTARVSGL